MKIALVIAINAAMACATWAEDASPQELVRQANAHLQAGQYDEAIEKYEQAAELLPDAAEIAYNRAIGHYRKGDFENAKEQFITSLKTRDPELEAKAKFNLGNCAYAAALAKKDNIPEAVEHLKSAILHYKDAIESNPQDTDARINIEMAQLLMKDLLDKQKQKQEEQQNQDQKEDAQKDQEEQDENKDQQQDQPSEQQDQQQPGDQEQQQEGESEPQQNEQQQGQQQHNEQKQQAGDDQKYEQQQNQNAEQQSQQGQKGQERKMTREEAKQLLQMIRDKEMQRRSELARRARVKLAPVDKDW
ncbi:MAG: tetratricopeptide repeat protein [Planctomycetes bacterium]|nr:tetratricopeptide repeat protein [Planctomycetota bacterium]